MTTPNPYTSSPYTSSPYFKVTFPHEYIAHVEIHRPTKLNAFIPPMWSSLPPLFSHLSTDPSIRCIIISGAGSRAFTSGLDVAAASSPDSAFATASPDSPSSSASSSSTSSSSSSSSSPTSSSLDPARKSSLLLRHISDFQNSITAIAKCTKPVVAAIHGLCWGLGVDLITACDVRFCSPGATFCVKEIDIGLAADIGTLTRLPKCVRSASWVKDVCLSARVFGAEEAGRQGLVSRIVGEGGKGGGVVVGVEEQKVAVVEMAMEWARGVVGKSPVAVQGTKELLDWGWDRGVEEGLRYTAVWNAGMLQTRDVREAMTAGMERRKARFERL